MRAADDIAEIRRRFDAAPDLVFSAFADPALVARWLRPTVDVRLEVLAYDFRVGGLYRFAYHVPGVGIMHVNGRFEVIERPAQIVFTWNIEPPDEHAGVASKVRVLITADGPGAELVVRHIKLSRPGAPERHAEGWAGALANLASLLQERVHGG